MSKKNMKWATLENIEKALRSSNSDVRAAAMQACSGRDIPVEIIERWLKDDDCDVRAAAMQACSGRDIPVEIIERGLKDDNWRVRAAAMQACERMGIAKPIVRTIEPPALVYKKCVADVIVVAEIPKDAQVRGQYGKKCRADKAIIKEIIGDFCGEKVGISVFDKTTAYYAGDEVKIDDFDMSDEECSTGFHFFCTREEAEAY